MGLRMRLLHLLKGRGGGKLVTYAEVMAHELEDNAHKGHWNYDETETPNQHRLRDPVEMLGDLTYHVAKLTAAVAKRDEVAILEYAADVGNCAWFVADRMSALDLRFIHDGPLETDTTRERVLVPPVLGAIRRESQAFVNAVVVEAGGQPAPLPDGPSESELPPAEMPKL